MILFGKDRERHFPIPGFKPAASRAPTRATVDRTEIRSLPVRAVEEAFVEKHTIHGADIGPVRRRERWSVPQVAGP